ncbi:hypothetical protein Tcan_03943 [Toxocara canis]|uniref:Uncharacterized protein n=1 Tax=Toxocara canis TaxID=6265 RepID=A0A0B2USL9_TOXCA|nr:hypothetical protein Tcan_03943 [Toxocara canis]
MTSLRGYTYKVDALAGLAWEATPSQETERGIAQRDKWAHLGCLSPCASTDHRQHTPSQNNSPKLRPPSWPHRGGLGPLQLHAQTKRCRQRSAKQLCGRQSIIFYLLYIGASATVTNSVS